MGLLQRSGAAEQWFSLLAPGYDAVVSSVFWPPSLQREAVEGLHPEPDDRVLDVGCGTGETVRHLTPRVASVHGVDLSGDQLATAREKDPLDEARFVQADAQSLPYDDDAFDRVVSVGSMMYWEDPGAVLREARRVTRPGGTVLAMGFNRRSASLETPVRNVQDVFNAVFFYRHDETEATRLFESAGWTDVEHTVTGPAWNPSLVLATSARNPE